LRPIAPSHARSDREDYAAFLARKTPLDMPTGREIIWTGAISDALSKFTREQEAHVRSRLSGGARVIDIAREFGVHRTTVSKIKMGTYRTGPSC
jgi:DNA invertase Pin-like site-specific DNA recombinase